MLKPFFLFLLIAPSLAGLGQSISGLNFRHVYDPQNGIDLQMRLVNEKTRLSVYYRLQQNGSPATGNYSIDWEKYNTVTQKEGTLLASGDSVGMSGRLSYPVPEKPWLLAAKVTDKSSSKTWNYVQLMEAKYPVNGFLEGADGIVFKSFAFLGQEYSFHGTGADKTLHVYVYKTDFPVASPPFTEKGAHVDRFLFADSSFQVAHGQKIVLKSLRTAIQKG